MNSIDRLLFVGAVLFIFLGLFEKQSQDTAASGTAEFNVCTTVNLEGILPSYPEKIFEHFRTGDLTPKILYDRIVQFKEEVIVSVLNTTRYRSVINRFCCYRSALQDKTGQLLHFQHCREIPVIS